MTVLFNAYPTNGKAVVVIVEEEKGGGNQEDVVDVF
jgi:hypothetical protein